MLHSFTGLIYAILEGLNIYIAWFIIRNVEFKGKQQKKKMKFKLPLFESHLPPSGNAHIKFYSNWPNRFSQYTQADNKTCFH